LAGAASPYSRTTKRTHRRHKQRHCGAHACI